MFAKGKNSLPYAKLIEQIPEESILLLYTNIKTIPSLYNSPFREDSNPSFSVFYSSTGRIHFKDFGTHESYNLVGFLLKLLKLQDVSELVNTILKDAHMNADKINLRKASSNIYRGSKNTLEVKVRKWQNYDLEFWEQYGINSAWLEFGKIYPISHIFISGQKIPADKYAYAYVEAKENKFTYKVYQPYSKEWKWINNNDSSVWDLWTQATQFKRDDLIITSSRKDALTLWANTGIPSVSLQSEGVIPKKHVVEQIQKLFKNIWCLYDNDYDKEENYGKQFSLNLSNKFNFKHIEIPDKWLSKDPSDLYLNHGKEVFKNVIFNQLKN